MAGLQGFVKVSRGVGWLGLALELQQGTERAHHPALHRCAMSGLTALHTPRSASTPLYSRPPQGQGGGSNPPPCSHPNPNPNPNPNQAKEEAERLHAQAQALVARRAGALHRAEKLQAERHRRAPIPPLHLPYISPASPLYLPCTSPIP